MAIWVLGYFTSNDEWCAVCSVEADSAESAVRRIIDVTDDVATDVIVRWNMEHYPEQASPRMLAADLGWRGTYGPQTSGTARLTMA
jgi:hypothetical protein